MPPTPVFPRDITIASVATSLTARVHIHTTEKTTEKRSRGLGPLDHLPPIRQTHEFVLNADDPRADVEKVEAFFRQRMGPYQAFFLPSFEIDALVEAPGIDNTPARAIIPVNNVSRFTTALYADGNFIAVHNPSTGYTEVRRIHEINVGSRFITTTTGFIHSGNFAVNSYVEVAHLVRFNTDTLRKSSHSVDRWTLDPLQFIEVFEFGIVEYW